MASSNVQASPFASAVVKAMRKLYPESLADKSFDNTGLLLEAPYRQGYLKNTALLTIDLTKAVADEAIARKDSIIVTYHPVIFRALKSITLANSQQQSLLRLAQEGISVYSPHTAVDAAPGGLNDWLADVITGKFSSSANSYTNAPHQRSVITPVTTGPPGFEKAGYGRVVRWEKPVPLGALIAFVRAGLGKISGLSVAVPQSFAAGSKNDIPISSVGICAGSGGSMLNGLDVDLLFTGELSHHEALAAIEQGKCVITAFHSNSERAFLEGVMKNALATELERALEQQEEDNMTDREQMGLKGGFEVAVSSVDRDPFEIVTGDATGW